MMASISTVFFNIKSGAEVGIYTTLPSDAEALIKFINQVAGQTNFLTMGAGDFQKTIEEEIELIQDHLDPLNRISLLAKHDGQIISHLNVQASQKERLRHIGEFGLTVDRAYWGEGVGSRMMEAMIDWAKKSSIIRKLNLRVMEPNSRAIRLYERFGFKIEGTVTRDLVLGDVFFDSYLMGLKID